LLHKLGFPDYFVSVNLSAKQFNQLDFTENLIKIIEKSGIDPSLVKLELTETAIMNHPAEAVEKLRVLKARFPKIRFMVDDFGTGYSSLSYLSRFPVDSLKNDISFVRDLFEKQNEKVVNAIIHLAHSLEMSIVPEGIETAEQRAYFRERDVRHLQGFYFMKGVPIKVLFEALHRQRNTSRPLR
jgi:Amt family ammonium transporter